MTDNGSVVLHLEVEGADMAELLRNVATRLEKFYPGREWHVDINAHEELLRNAANTEVTPLFYRADVVARLKR